MLANLSLSQIARNPSESQCPGLRGVRAYFPILGRQGLEGPGNVGEVCIWNLSGAGFPGRIAERVSYSGSEPVWALSDKGVVLQQVGTRDASGITCGMTPFAAANEMTFEILFKPSIVNENQMIAEDGTAYNTSCFYLYLQNNGTLQFSTHTTGSNFSDVVSAALSSGHWYHVFGTRNGTDGRARIWVNGVEAVSGTALISPLYSTPNAGLMVGGRPNTSNQVASLPFYSGSQIALWRCHNKQLRRTEIQTLMADPLLPLRRKLSVGFYVPGEPSVPSFRPYFQTRPQIIGAAS